MNERQFQGELVAEAPMSVPDSLRERVDAIAEEAVERTAPRSNSANGPRSGKTLGLTDIARQPRMIAMLVGAALLAVMAVGLGMLIREWITPVPTVVPIATILPVPTIAPSPPAALPENGLIMVTSWGDGSRAIVIDPATGEVVPLEAGSGGLPEGGVAALDSATSAGWSPDGGRVAFTTGRSVGVLDLATGEQSTVAQLACGEGNACAVTWSPDGRSIAFSGGSNLVVADLVDGTMNAIVSAMSATIVNHPRWSPDGQTIAFASPTEVFTVDASGGIPRAVVSGPEAGSLIYDLRWSPDGSRIGYLTAVGSNPDTGNQLAIVTVRPDGSDRTVLADAGDCFCIGYGPPGFTWSPDGTQLAIVTLGYAADVARARDAPVISDGGGLFLANADGSGIRLIHSGLAGTPSWQAVP